MGHEKAPFADQTASGYNPVLFFTECLRVWGLNKCKLLCVQLNKLFVESVTQRVAKPVGAFG